MATKLKDLAATEETGHGQVDARSAFNDAASAPVPTPKEFFMAARSGSIEVLEDMIARKTALNAQDSMGDTALMLAVREGRHDAVQVLLEAGADPNIKNHIPMSVLILAIVDRDEKMVGLLLEHGADPDGTSDLDILPLMVAAEAGLEGIAGKLLEKKAKTYIGDSHGNLPVHAAVLNGHAGMVRLLKKHGTSLDARNAENISPLDQAIWKKRDDRMFDLLVELGADVHKADPNNTSCVHRAAEADNEHALGKLIGMSADMTKADGRGHTPLISAAINGSGKAAKMLLEQGVPMEGPHPDRHSPRRHAELKGHQHVVNIIDTEKGRRVRASIITDIRQGVKGGMTAPKRASFKKQQGRAL